MELSNFELVRSDGLTIFAKVDVTTSGFLWRKVARRLVAKDGPFWVFVDTGAFTPGFQCENLYASFKLRETARAQGVSL